MNYWRASMAVGMIAANLMLFRIMFLLDRADDRVGGKT
jgi:hypothetical protein